MAAATFRESMPGAIGMIARRSAACSQRDERPCPSEPRTSATWSTPGDGRLDGLRVSARVSATVVNPSADRVGSASYQSSRRVHGSREHRAHAHLDRAPVERVGAPRRQEYGVEAQRGAGAEDRADVGVVDDVLEHQDRPGVLQDRGRRGQRTPLQRGQRTSVHVEAGHLLGERLRDHEAGRRRRGEHVGQPVQPARRHQERPRREPGLDGAAYDLLALGEEQPVLGLEVLAQLDVAQVAVVGQPRVRSRVDQDLLSHTAPGGQPPRPRRSR